MDSLRVEKQAKVSACFKKFLHSNFRIGGAMSNSSLIKNAMFLLIPFFFAASHIARAEPFKKVMIVVFENTDAAQAEAQPFFSSIAKKGLRFDNFFAETHPSQGNYVALISGDQQNIHNDSNVNIDAPHLGDLLEKAGKTWKVYAEGYPGNCFLGARSGNYVRKHVPFLSFKNVQESPTRCANIQNSSSLESDIASGELPDFSMFIPDLKNDGHDTGVAFADSWAGKFFSPLLANPAFMKDMLVIFTFDESSMFGGNLIYTAFVGSSVEANTVFTPRVTHYDVLRTIEDHFNLGTLGRSDLTAKSIF